MRKMIEMPTSVKKTKTSSQDCSGTVYHSSTVNRPQNICRVCGQSFLFQLQLRVHLETHDDDEENGDENGDENEIDTNTSNETYKSRESNKLQIVTLHTNTGEYDAHESDIEVGNLTFDEDHAEQKIGVGSVEDDTFEQNNSTDYEITINEITDYEDDSENEKVENENVMDVDFGTVEEVSKSAVVENDVNLDEVITQINKEEETQNQNERLTKSSEKLNESATETLKGPGTEVIVINKDVKLGRKPDASKLRYECHVCQEMFQWPYQLKRHINIHSGLYPYECEICGKKFDRSSSLKDHALVHSKDRPFECEVCHTRFSLKTNLNKHMNRHTKSRVWQCEHCRKPFLQRDQLIAHLIVHKGVKPWNCEVCGKGFARKMNLKEHMITHSTVKNYPCDFCHKTFNKPYSKKVHMRNHLNTKPHKCKVCGASFSQSCALVSHIRRHTGERPFACPMCPLSFAQQSTLKTHVMSHTGEKNYKCGECSKAFMRKRCLTEHIRTHTGEKPFKCMLCDFASAVKIGLRKHIETHVKQLIRNGDIDLSGLIELQQPEDGKTGSSDLKSGNSDEAAVSAIDMQVLDENNEVTENSDEVSVHVMQNENSLDQHEIYKPQIVNNEKGSSVYRKGLDIIVGEINKHCNKTFDPKLLDKNFVMHIINQSSLLSQNVERAVKEPTRLECEVCKKIFPHKKLMTEHMKIHRPLPEVLKKHECDICNKRFLHAKSLLFHKRSHAGEKPYYCERCSAGYSSKRALRMHYKNIHVGLTVVESAQEYAAALTEKAEIEDLDNKTVNSVKPEGKPKKQKAVKKGKNTAVKKRKNRIEKNALNDDTVSNESGILEIPLRSKPGTEILMSTEGILKQAELAAKSICESLFSGSSRSKTAVTDLTKIKNASECYKGENGLQISPMQTVSESPNDKDNYSFLRQALISAKPVKHSNISKESVISRKVVNTNKLRNRNEVVSDPVHTKSISKVNSTSAKSNTPAVKDSFSLLRQALGSVKPNNMPQSEIPIKAELADASYFDIEPSGDSVVTKAAQFVPSLDGSFTPHMESKINGSNKICQNDKHSLTQAQGDGKHSDDLYIGKTIQNEYETLRISLQKSLNSIMLAPLLDD